MGRPNTWQCGASSHHMGLPEEIAMGHLDSTQHVQHVQQNVHCAGPTTSRRHLVQPIPQTQLQVQPQEQQNLRSPTKVSTISSGGVPPELEIRRGENEKVEEIKREREAKF